MRLSIRNVEIGYRGKTVVVIDSLDINEGEIIALIGPNGSGKTTFLRCLAGVLKPFNGKVEVNGIDIYSSEGAKLRKIIGYMPAEYSPPESLTVKEFVEFWCTIYGTPCNLNDVPIPLHKKIEELSSGQKRLLSLYRVFLQNPRILILDEPTANLDINNRLMLYDKINLIKEGRIILYSTHDISDLPIFATRILFIKDGRLVVDSSLEELKKNFVIIKGNIKNFLLDIKLIKIYNKNKFLIRYNGKISELVKKLVENGNEIEEVSEISMYELYKLIMEDKI
ncbi:MAG: ABC transporter ATP-binding protein [Sulfolobaceae archaeon]